MWARVLLQAAAGPRGGGVGAWHGWRRRGKAEQGLGKAGEGVA